MTDTGAAMREMGMNSVTKYVIDPTRPFPKRWRDHIGPIRVMGGPHQGYLMVRRPGAIPFVLHVSEILNAERHPIHGPFEIVGDGK